MDLEVNVKIDMLKLVQRKFYYVSVKNIYVISFLSSNFYPMTVFWDKNLTMEVLL